MFVFNIHCSRYCYIPSFTLRRRSASGYANIFSQKRQNWILMWLNGRHKVTTYYWAQMLLSSIVSCSGVTQSLEWVPHFASSSTPPSWNTAHLLLDLSVSSGPYVTPLVSWPLIIQSLIIPSLGLVNCQPYNRFHFVIIARTNNLSAWLELHEHCLLAGNKMCYYFTIWKDGFNHQCFVLTFVCVFCASEQFRDGFCDRR